MNALRKPPHAVVEISSTSHAKLQELAQAEGRPMGEIVNHLIERYEPEQFWKQAHEAVERLRADPEAWKDYRAEMSMLQGGSMDGLEVEPPSYTPEEEEAILAEHARTQGRWGVGRHGRSASRAGTTRRATCPRYLQRRVQRLTQRSLHRCTDNGTRPGTAMPCSYRAIRGRSDENVIHHV